MITTTLDRHRVLMQTRIGVGNQFTGTQLRIVPVVPLFGRGHWVGSSHITQHAVLCGVTAHIFGTDSDLVTWILEFHGTLEIGLSREQGLVNLQQDSLVVHEQVKQVGAILLCEL